MVFWLVFATLISHLLGIPYPISATGASLKPSVSSQEGVQAVTPEQFQVALTKQLRQQFSLKGVEFSVQIHFPKQSINVPKGRLGIQVPPDTMNGRTGRRAFRIALHVDSRFVRTVNIVAELSAHAQVVAPVRFVKAREVLSSADVSLIDFALPSLQHDFLQQLNQSVGMKAVRLLPPNMPIQRSFLTAPPVIRKGDRVIIEARHGALVVQTVGVAKDSGEPGKTIAVENQTSGREVLGRVLRAGLVEVQF